MSEEKKIVKKINSKSKGSGFESTIAKLFTETFAPIQFRRSQSSGAILGGQNQVHLHRFSNDAKTLFIGDIVPTNEADVMRAEDGFKFKFCIECKFYKEADTFAALFKNPQILTWFNQVRIDSLKIDEKHPLLVFKFNHSPIYIGFNIEAPSTVTRIIQINDVKFCLMEDALKDLSWWKIYNDQTAIE